MPGTGQWRVAIHEAGHGLIARHVGNQVDSLSIRSGPGYDGAARHSTFEGTTKYTMPERFILTSVAGYMAERLMLGDNDPTMCHSDRENAWQGAVGQCIGEDAEAFASAERLWNGRVPIDDPRWPNSEDAKKLVADMERECYRLLEGQRTELERLATHLEAHQECHGEDIEAICNGTWKAS
jgi:ATP-dependent Zn protease